MWREGLRTSIYRFGPGTSGHPGWRGTDGRQTQATEMPRRVSRGNLCSQQLAWDTSIRLAVLLFDAIQLLESACARYLELFRWPQK
jgi:hypothetical protein